MFSPLENEDSEDWFQRLNAPLKRLPADERTEIHQEVRQHLEALARANEELGSSPEEAWNHALKQFGDPNKFGNKMVQEWHLGETGFRADMTTILACFGLQLACFGLQTLLVTGGSWLPNWWKVSHHNAHLSSFIYITGYAIFFVALIIVPTVIGRKFPAQAIKGVFYERVFSFLFWLLYIIFNLLQKPSLLQSTSSMLTHGLLWTPISLAIVLGTTYLASVTKRGWYRPSWADFKITLPKRRRQAN